MPKLKSKSAAKKRFSTTASGKLKRNYAFKSHNLSKRSKSMKRKTRGAGIMHPTNAKQVRPMLPYAR